MEISNAASYSTRMIKVSREMFPYENVLTRSSPKSTLNLWLCEQLSKDSCPDWDKRKAGCKVLPDLPHKHSPTQTHCCIVRSQSYSRKLTFFMCRLVWGKTSWFMEHFQLCIYLFSPPHSSHC